MSGGDGQYSLNMDFPDIGFCARGDSKINKIAPAWSSRQNKLMNVVLNKNGLGIVLPNQWRAENFRIGVALTLFACHT